MSFKGCDDEFPASAFLNLSEDGQTVTAVFVGEPEPRHGEYRGKDRVQAMFPVLDLDGLHVWPVGITMYKRLKDRWDELKQKVVRITRRGAKGSQSTTYELQVVKGSKGLLEALRVLKREDHVDLWERVANAGTDASTAEAPPVDPDEPGPSDPEASAGRSRKRQGGQPQEIPL